jgi:putative transposase
MPTGTEKYRVIQPVLENSSTAKAVAAGSQVPLRTIQHWVKRFKDDGLKGLERKTRKDKDSHTAIGDGLKETAIAMAIGAPHLPVAAIHDKLKEIASMHSEHCPSYGLVSQIVKKIDPAILLLAQQGAKAYREKYELIFRRECQRPNQIWQADHSLLDIYLLNAKAEYQKPWLTVVVDDFSRAVCGYCLSFDAPSSMRTALALRHAIMQKGDPMWQVCGIPQVLYTDHGSDFMSAHIERACLNLKIRMINSQVGRPQGRGKIERFFRTLNENLLAKLPGFSVGGKPVTKPKLDIAAAERAIGSYIIEGYNHGQHGTTEKAPVSLWASGGFLPQLPASADVLDELLVYTDRPRKVQRDGIHFNGMRYLSTTLAGFVGETVLIKYDPRDMATVKVYHNDRFLCRAVCQDIDDLVISLKEIKKARDGIRHGLYKQIKEARQVFKEVAAPPPQAVKKKGGGKSNGRKPDSGLKHYSTD